MKILSLDIGIKNLAFCLFESINDNSINGNNSINGSNSINDYKIKAWDIINLTEENEPSLCEFIEKTKPCLKPSKYIANNQCFCLKHSKKQNYLIPTPELKSSFINKQKFKELMEIADKYDIKYEKSCKKTELINKINEYINTNCFTEVKAKNASTIDLITIGKNIKHKFNKLFLSEGKIDYVIIENQMSLIAQRMKTIQGMVAQYFIMNDTANKIEFISASNKLKDCGIKEKTTYNERKKLGIQKCLEILNSNHKLEDKINHFQSHKKKDDLSDCFLQGLWFISTSK
jgi:hypothetical protein